MVCGGKESSRAPNYKSKDTHAEGWTFVRSVCLVISAARVLGREG